MSKLILPLLLIASGIFIIIQGTRREDSVVGVSETIGTSVANAWDGKARQPDHIWYYVGGGALILAGAGLALRRPKA